VFDNNAVTIYEVPRFIIPARESSATMRLQRLKLRHVLFAAAFFLALIIRAAGAGQSDIATDAEAALALQAMAVSSGQNVLLLPHPAYLALTVP
jgi:hypothetical protein